MNARQGSNQTRPFAAMLLSLVLATSVAEAAPADVPAAGNTNASVTAPAPGAPAGVHVSPHARAARQRAAAQAEAGPPTGIRVSVLNSRHKPHTVPGHR